MNDAKFPSEAVFEQIGREFQSELGNWAASQSQVSRAGARLMRQGFKREAAPLRSRGWFFVPAGLGLALAGFALFFAMSFGFSGPLTYTVNGKSWSDPRMQAQTGHAAELAFSDGSKVIAEPGTRCSVVDVTPNGARVDIQHGSIEAAIQHREHTAWTVSAGPFKVVVTGTRFSVAWDEVAAKMSVRLHEGSVTVSGRCIGERKLKSGEELAVSCEGQKSLQQPAEATVSEPAPRLPSTATAPEEAAPEGSTLSVNEKKADRKAPAPDGLRDELKSLAEVRRELEHNPGRALQLAEANRAKYPAGALAEEREALALFALDRLGHHGEFRTRSARFLAKYPLGPFSAKVRGILEHVAEPSR